MTQIKTIKSAMVERRIQELEQMFREGGEYTGTVHVDRNVGNNKIMVTIRTKDILPVVSKDESGFHGALTDADNYSFHAEGDELVVRLGFFIGYYPNRSVETE